MGNDIKLALLPVNDFRLGTDPVSKVYLGPTLIWPSCISEYWVSILSGEGQSLGYGVATDEEGNIFITGGYGGLDLFIAKFDVMGDVLWQRLINAEDVISGDLDLGTKITVDGDGNLYVVGYSFLRNPQQGSGSNFQVLLLKCDSEGDLIWQRRLGVPWDCKGADLNLDGEGNIYITGEVKRVPTITDAILLAKFDTTGELQWQKMLSESYGDSNWIAGFTTPPIVANYKGSGISLDESGNSYIVANKVTVTNLVSSSYKVIVTKCSPGGSPIWAKALSHTGEHFTIGNSIIRDSASNVYVTGYANLQDLGLSGLLLAKFDANGSPEWQTLLSGELKAEGIGITLSSDNSLIVTGYVMDGGVDSILIVKCDAGSGSVIWQHVLNLGLTCYGIDVNVRDGNIFISGALENNNGQFKLITISVPDSPTQLLGEYGTKIYKQANLQAESVSFTIENVELINRAPFLNEAATSLTVSPTSLIDSAISATVSPLSLNSLPIASWVGNLGKNYWITALENPYSAPLLGLTVDSSGNVHVAGTLNSKPLLIKYNNNGVIQWQNTVEGLTGGKFTGVVTDSSGNCYACGTFIFGGQDSAALVKYNEEGNLQWQRQLNNNGSSPSSSFAGIAIDSSGNLYCAGSIGGGGLLVKYNSSGVLQWQGEFAETLETDILGVSVDNSGSVYVTGSANTGTSTGSYNIVIAKFSGTGEVEWQRRLSSPQVDNGNAIVVDNAGNSYVVGEAFRSNPVTWNEIVLAKYDTNGAIVWQRSLGSTGAVGKGSGVTVDGEGNVFVVGNTGLSSGNAVPMVIVKFNSEGEVQFLRRLNPTSSGSEFGINNVYLGGSEFRIAAYEGDPYVSRVAAIWTSSNLPQNYYLLTAKLPSDGSGIGTYGNITYEDYSLPDYPLVPSVATTPLTNTVSNVPRNRSSFCPTCDEPPYFCNTNVNPYCVIDFTGAWQNCTSLTSFPLLDTSSGVDFSETWYGCTGLTSFPVLNLSSGQIFSNTWDYCTGLTSFPGTVDLSSGTNFVFSWGHCTSLTSFPGTLDLSSGVNFAYSWSDCTSLTSFPGTLNLSSGTNFNGAWYNCTSLASFPPLNLGSGIGFAFSWMNCTSLAAFPGTINLGSGSNFNGTWQNCTALTSFPGTLNLSSGTNFPYAWSGCTSLVNFPANVFDNCPATNFSSAWGNCALSQQSVDNILVSLDTAGQSNGVVHINGGTSSSPGAAGLAAKSSLQGKGWTVVTN